MSLYDIHGTHENASIDAKKAFKYKALLSCNTQHASWQMPPGMAIP
jgi:hypothetical protein